jgi:hypothetical protein
MSQEKELTFVFALRRRQQRFREITIADKCREAEFFGAVKLNKILYRLDFRAFRRLGTPITGVGYFRQPHAPAPTALVPVRSALERFSSRKHRAQRERPELTAALDFLREGDTLVVSCRA